MLAEERVDTYSMFKKNISLFYDDLLSNYDTFSSYLCNIASSFSLVSNMNKPYAQYPPAFEHHDAVKMLDPFLERYQAGIKEWPGTTTKDNHKILLVYRLCRESKKLLRELPNFLLPQESNLPEDICFYRGKQCCFATVSHERMAFFSGATNEDITFFKNNKIRFYD